MTNRDNTKRTIASFLIGNGYNVGEQFRMRREIGNKCFLPPDRFFNMVVRKDPCTLRNPWNSLFKVTFSTLAFFITN